MRWTTIATLWLLCAPALPGQQIEGAPRARAFGLAHGADGAPWVDAEVHFLHHLWMPLLDGDEATDHVVVRTDERGRFGAQLIVGRSYVCWAETEGDDGRCLFSNGVERIGAGERVELVARDQAEGPTHIELTGFEPGELAALEPIVDEPWSGVAAVPIERESDGRIRIPPLVQPTAQLRLVGADGTPRLQVRVPNDGGEHTVAPGAGHWIRARVFDLDAKQPIAGARIVRFDGGTSRELARTGEDGTAELDLARLSALVDGEEVQTGHLGLCVLADGWHVGMLQVDGVTERRTTRGQLDDHGEIDVECRPQRIEASGLTGRLLIGGEPAVGWPLRVMATAWHRDDDSSSTGIGVQVLVRTGPDGVFRFDGLSDGDEPFEILLGGPQLRSLPERWRRGLPASISLPIPRSDGEPTEIDLLTGLRALALQLTAYGDGAPVVGADIVYGSLVQHAYGATVKTDRSGRVTILVSTAEREPLILSTRSAQGWAVVEITPPALGARPAAEPIAVQIPLRRMVRIRGSLRLPDGVPTPKGAWVSSNPDWSSFGGDVAMTPQPSDREPWRLLEPDEVTPEMLGGMSASHSSKGDTFELLLPGAPAVWRISGWLSHDGSSYHGETQIALEGNEDVVEVEVEVVPHQE